MDDLLMEVRRTPHAAYLDDLLMKVRRTPPIPRGQNVEWRALFQAGTFRTSIVPGGHFQGERSGSIVSGEHFPSSCAHRIIDGIGRPVFTMFC